MIDMFALLLVHGLLAIALYRLMMDDTVDQEEREPLPDPSDSNGIADQGAPK